MATLRRTIRKYPNRRLYDAGISSYVTLEDLRQLVIDGVDFQVVDARSGADLTRAILLQIIAANEMLHRPVLTSPLLCQVIRLHGHARQDLAGPHLERSLAAFMEQPEPEVSG